MIWLIDIDGTIADNTHRKHLDWNDFLAPENVVEDLPIAKGVAAVKHLAMDPNNRVIFLTGRNEGLRPVTTEWLYLHGFDNLTPLVMRGPAHDGLPASQFKERIIRDLLQQHRGDLVMVDDDPYILAMVRKFKLGLALLAPDCWDVINPTADHLPPEADWRK